MPRNIDGHECGESKTDHSSQPSAQVKMCEVYSIPHHAITMWVQKHRDSFTFAVSSSFLILR